MSDVCPEATVDDLFSGKTKRRYTYVELPQMRRRVRIQSITEREFSDYQASAFSKTQPNSLSQSRLRDAQRRFIAMCLVDEAGNLLCNGTRLDLIGEWDARDSNHLYEECTRWCGIKESDIEDMVKNSSATIVVS